MVYVCSFKFVRLNLMDVYMNKKLLSIKAFIISLFPFVPLETSVRSYINTPRNTKIFKASNDITTIFNNSSYRHFLTINIPVL